MLARGRYAILSFVLLIFFSNIASAVDLHLNSNYDMGDIYYYNNPDFNYAFQIKWNISSIPDGATITDATLCMHINTPGSIDSDATIYRVNDQTWDESVSTATLNSQTLTNQTAGTWSSSVDETYSCVNVTTQVKTDFDASNTYASLRLIDPDALPGTAQSVGRTNPEVRFGHTPLERQFKSRDYGSDEPYLNITYLAAPTIALNAPANDSNFSFSDTNVSALLNATVTDAESDPMCVEIFGDNSANPSTESLLYWQCNVASGTTITYNWTSPVVNSVYADTTGLVLSMHFDNRSEYGENNTHVYDFSGMGNNGTITGSTYNANGKFAQCIQSSASANRVQVTGSSSLNIVNDITVSTWVYLPATTHSSWNYFIDHNGKYEFDIYGTGMEPRFKLENNVGTYFEVSSSEALNTHEWYHIVATRNGSAVRLYVNGVQKASRTDFTGSIATSTDPLTIGGDDGSSYLNGSIDEIAIWNRSLTADEIMDLYRLKNGTYYWNANSSDAGATTTSETWQFNANPNFPPNIVLISPANDSNFTHGIWNITLTTRATDADDDLMCVEIFGDSSAIPSSESLLYKECSVASTTVTSQVSHSNGDAEEDLYYHTVDIGNSDLELAFDYRHQEVGVRFPSVNIPQGVIITDATIQFECDEASSEAVTIYIYGHDIDNAPTFSTAAYNVSNRAKTSAYASWVPGTWVVDVKYNSSDISSIVQEIVNRPGWSSGNSMAFIMNSTADTHSKSRIAESYDSEPTNAAKLYVSYMENIEYNWTSPVVNSVYANTTGLILGLHLDNRSEYGENNTHVYDFSGQGNNGSCSNCPTFNQTGGKFAGAFDFDGSNDEFIVMDAADPTAYTLSAWVKPSSTNNMGIIVRSDATGPGVSFSHELRITDGPAFQHYTYASWTPKYVTGSTIVQAGGWYHVVGVATNNGGMKLYVNGVEEGTPETIGTLYTGLDRWYIGANDGGGHAHFNGIIDEVAIWNRSLSATEVSELYRLKADTYYWKVNASDANDTATSETWQFTILSPPDSCGYINSDKTLTSDINANGTCFIINASNIVLDGAGYTIAGNGSGYGIYLPYSGAFDNVSVRNFGGINSFNYGIYLSRTTNSIINNTVIQNSTTDGIYLTSSSNNNIITNNIIFNSGDDGIQLNVASNNNITSNNISKSADIGITISGVSNSNRIENNTVHNNTNDGIRSGGSANNTLVTHNRIYSNNDDGIQITDSSTYTTVSHNQIYSNIDDGINIDTSSDNGGILENNTIYNHGGSTDVGIKIESSSNTIKDNTIHDNGNGILLLMVINNVSNNLLINNNITAITNDELSDLSNSNNHNSLIYNNSFGEIRWNKTNLTTAINLERNVTILLEDNLVGLIDDPNTLNLNSSAQIELRGLLYGSTPQLLKNGVRCDDTDDCNISYNIGLGILYANVSSFSNYTTQNASDSCGYINSDKTLTSDINVNGTCFIINASNIVLDGAGYAITGNGSGYGIDATGGFDNITIRNFGGITNFDSGIHTSGMTDSYIFNNTIDTSSTDQAIQIRSSSNNNVIDNNDITSDGHAIAFYSSSNNNVTNNTINLTDAGSAGVRFQVSSGARIISNNITVNFWSSTGIITYVGSNNHWIESNTVYTYDTDADGISIGSSSNTVTLNNVYTTEATSYGIRIRNGIYAGENNNITNNNVTTTDASSAGIFVDSECDNNIISSNNLSTNANDIRINNVTGARLIDQVASNYSINISTFSVESSGVAKVTFLEDVTQDGTNLSNDIQITSNLIQVDSVARPGFNVSANLTFYGTDGLGFSDRTPFRNGASCPSNICTELQDADNYIFNVTSFTNYSVGEGASDSCGYINSDKTLTSDINVNGTCFIINASNIVLDGAGYTITGNGSGYGIDNTGGFDNVTIRNFGGINNFDSGIYVSGMTDSYIFNNTITDSATKGIYLPYSANNNLTFNNITSSGNNSYGLYLHYSNSINNRLISNTIDTSGNYSHGIWLHGSPNNTVISNIVTTAGIGSSGIYSEGSANSTLTSNNLTTYGTDSYGIYVRYLGSVNNRLTSNIINTNGTGSFGIWLRVPPNCTLTSNIINTNRTYGTGILVDYSSGNQLISNTVNTLGNGAYGIHLEGNSNNNILVNNNLLATYAYTREIQDTTGDSYTNYLIYNNSYGEIRWTNSSNGGFLKDMDVNGPIGLGTNLFIGNNTAALNTSAFGATAEINSSANITLVGLSYTSITDIYEVPGYDTNSTNIINTGSNCLGSKCNQISYGSGVLIFNTTGFSSFAANEITANFTYLINETTTTSYGYLNGTLDQIFYNNSLFALQLNATYNNGSYLSQIFNAGATVQWNNISWLSNTGELLDNQQSDVTVNMTGNKLLFHLDELSGSLIDSSGYSHTNSSVGNTVAGGNGIFNKGLMFNVPYAHLDVSGTNNNFTNAPFTYAFWINSTSTSGLLTWAVKSRLVSPWYQWKILFYPVSGTVQFWAVNGTGGQSLSATDHVTANKFNHVAVQINESNAMIMYINGIKQPNTLNLNNYVTGSDGSLMIGYDAGASINGTLDEVAFWNRSLSDQEILDLYKRGVTRLNLSVRSCNDASCIGESFTDINDTSPQSLSLSNNQYFQYNVSFETDNVSYTPELYNVTINYGAVTINDTIAPSINFTLPTPNNGSSQSNTDIFVNVSSSDANDHYAFVDFDNDLMLWMRMDDVNASGDPIDLSSYGNNGTLQGNTFINSTGKFGNASWFDGNNDKIFIDDIVTGDSSTVSIFAWVYASDLDQHYVYSSDGLAFGVKSSSGDLGHAFNINGTTVYPCCTSTITAGTWHHIGFTYNGHNLRFYINGQFDTEKNYSGPLVTPFADVYIGARQDGLRNWNGSIDEVLVFNRTLSAQEILALYNGSSDQYYHNFTGLSTGQHNFTAYAVDTSGNKNETEERTVTITASDSCGYINSDKTLTSNITTSGTCFIINASDITINGAGYTITGDGTGYGIDNTGGFDNVTIANITILNFNEGIRYTDASNSTINNTNINATTYCIYLQGASDNNIIDYVHFIQCTGYWQGNIRVNGDNNLLTHLNFTYPSQVLVGLLGNNNTLRDSSLNTAQVNGGDQAVLVNGNYTKIINNTIRTSPCCSYETIFDNAAITNLNISYNYFTSWNQGGAISLGSVSDSYIGHNTFDLQFVGQWPTSEEIIVRGTSSIISEENNLSHTIRVTGGLLNSTNDILDYYDIEGGSTIATNSTYNTLTVTGGEITVRWYVDTNVTNQLGTPLNGADVTIYNISSDQVFNGLTDPTGKTGYQTLTEFFRNNTTTVYHTPHNVSGTKAGYTSNSTTLNLSQTNTVIVNLSLSTSGNYIVTNPPTGTKFVRADNTSIDVTSVGQSGLVEVLLGKNSSLGNYSGSVWIAFASNVDFADAIIDTNRATAKSVLHNTSGISQIVNRSLLIPRITNSGQVYVCPDAESLAEVTTSCPSKVVINVGQTVSGMTVSNVAYDGENYYKVTNITGTGGGEGNDPEITLNAPANNSNFTQVGDIILNATVTDPNSDPMTVQFFAYGSPSVSDAHGLVYQQNNVANGTTLTYNITALPATPDANTILLLHLDNRSEYGENSTHAYDFSGNENNGTVTNATFAQSGRFGGAYYFGATSNRYITVPYDASLSTNDITISMWIKRTTSNAWDYLIHKSNGATTDYYIDFVGDNSIRFYRNGFGSHNAASLIPPLNEWSHIVVTYDDTGGGSDVMKFYYNGALNHTSPTGFGTPTNNAVPITIGDANDHIRSFYNGYMDEVAIYNRVLNDTEILNLYRLENDSYYWRVNASDGSNTTQSETRLFNVGALPTDSCGYINADKTLVSNIVTNGTCFIVNASNIVIDGAGYTITSNGSGYGIHMPFGGGFDNVTVRNFGGIN
ncbi:right-handed parallel beta-helix repeat-containing protein, partial [Candidatus Micrarchaeota archaeon]|nr:right-handed parallel beta-helix repeat-containing protein [Candidatus Micrarchaeota archaeon]